MRYLYIEIKKNIILYIYMIFFTGDIIIQQIEAQSYPPAPPIIIRQQPPRPRTPEPLV